MLPSPSTVAPNHYAREGNKGCGDLCKLPEGLQDPYSADSVHGPEHEASFELGPEHGLRQRGGVDSWDGALEPGTVWRQASRISGFFGVEWRVGRGYGARGYGGEGEGGERFSGA